MFSIVCNFNLRRIALCTEHIILKAQFRNNCTFDSDFGGKCLNITSLRFMWILRRLTKKKNPLFYIRWSRLTKPFYMGFFVQLIICDIRNKVTVKKAKCRLCVENFERMKCCKLVNPNIQSCVVLFYEYMYFWSCRLAVELGHELSRVDSTDLLSIFTPQMHICSCKIMFVTYM